MPVQDIWRKVKVFRQRAHWVCITEQSKVSLPQTYLDPQLTHSEVCDLLHTSSLTDPDGSCPEPVCMLRVMLRPRSRSALWIPSTSRVPLTIPRSSASAEPTSPPFAWSSSA